MAGWFARGRGGDLLALVAGGASVLAFAPFGAWPLAILCPALLFALWVKTPARRAAWRGFLYGAAEFLAGIYWIYIAVSGLGPGPWWLGVLLYVALALACAAFPALLGYVLIRIAPRVSAAWLLILPGGWVLLEWVRSFVLTGFPWLALGFSQPDHWLGGYAPVLGIYGVSLAAVLAAVLVVLFFARRSPGGRAAMLVGLGAVFGLGAGLGAVHWVHPAGPAFTISLVQGDIPQQLKWQPSMQGPTLRRYATLTREHFSSDVVVWPEAAVPVWLSEVEPPLARLAGEARTHGTTLVLGVPMYDFSNDAGYNAVVAFNNHISAYYKRHLVPFGEYFPVPAWVKHWLRGHQMPYSSFTPGPRVQPPLAVGKWRAAVANCYEVAFGRLLITQLPAAEFIINPSDDGWFGHSIALAQQFQMAQMAARETARYVVAVTDSGITGIIGARGRVRARLPKDEVGVLTGKVRPLAGATPYVRLGNWAVTVLAGFMLLVGAAFAVFRRRRSSD